MMTAEEPQVKPETAPEAAPEGAPETPVQPEAAPETPAEAPAAPAEPENPLAAELAAAKERYLRLLADMDNMRKRQTRELEERTARANERLLTALLPVFDHFEMALAAAPAALTRCAPERRPPPPPPPQPGPRPAARPAPGCQPPAG